MCLEVYWVLCIMHGRCALEGAHFIWASVLTHEEGSLKRHHINQKQTQSSTKLATKASLLHIYFSKGYFCVWNQRSFLMWASYYSSLLPQGILSQTYVPTLVFSQSCHTSTHCSFSIHDILLEWNSYGSSFSSSAWQMSIHPTTQTSGKPWRPFWNIFTLYGPRRMYQSLCSHLLRLPWQQVPQPWGLKQL